jgi:hypothetical protein
MKRWHRAEFRCYWRMLRRHRPGGLKLTHALCELIRKIATEIPTGELPGFMENS